MTEKLPRAPPGSLEATLTRDGSAREPFKAQFQKKLEKDDVYQNACHIGDVGRFSAAGECPGTA